MTHYPKRTTPRGPLILPSPLLCNSKLGLLPTPQSFPLGSSLKWVPKGPPLTQKDLFPTAIAHHLQTPASPQVQPLTSSKAPKQSHGEPGADVTIACLLSSLNSSQLRCERGHSGPFRACTASSPASRTASGPLCPQLSSLDTSLSLHGKSVSQLPSACLLRLL